MGGPGEVPPTGGDENSFSRTFAAKVQNWQSSGDEMGEGSPYNRKVLLGKGLGGISQIKNGDVAEKQAQEAVGGKIRLYGKF